jgi:hypothetical protein
MAYGTLVHIRTPHMKFVHRLGSGDGDVLRGYQAHVFPFLCGTVDGSRNTR